MWFQEWRPPEALLCSLSSQLPVENLISDSLIHARRGLSLGSFILNQDLRATSPGQQELTQLVRAGPHILSVEGSNQRRAYAALCLCSKDLWYIDSKQPDLWDTQEWTSGHTGRVAGVRMFCFDSPSIVLTLA